MTDMRIGRRLTACFAMTLAPLCAFAQVPARPAKPATPTRTAAIDPIRADRLLLAIAAREEKCLGKGLDLDPADKEACSSRAMDAANALVSRSGTQRRFASLMHDLFEPMTDAMGEGDPGEADVVTALGIEADLAQRRAAILTGATAAERAIERAENADAGASPPPRKHSAKPQGLFDWVDRDRHFMESPEAGIHTRPLALRWQAIRDADCAAYPVPHCAVRLDAAMRNMFEDLEG